MSIDASNSELQHLGAVTHQGGDAPLSYPDRASGGTDRQPTIAGLVAMTGMLVESKSIDYQRYNFESVSELVGHIINILLTTGKITINPLEDYSKELERSVMEIVRELRPADPNVQNRISHDIRVDVEDLAREENMHK